MATRAPTPGLLLLVLLTALSVLSLNMFVPSLSAMSVDFGTDYGTISLAIGGYLAATAFLQLAIGPLSDRYGRRPVLLGALVVFAAGSAGCAVAEDIHIFLAFRVLQGTSIAGWVIALAMIRDTASEREAAGRIGYVSMAMAIAPMLAPMAGGAVDAMFGWRANFYIYVGLGAALLIVCMFAMPETNRDRADTLAGQMSGYPALLGSPAFWGYSLCGAFSTSAFYAFLAGVPFVAQATLSLPAAELGFNMGSITGGFFFGSFLAGRFATRYPLAGVMVAGRLLACAGLTAGLVFIAAGHVTVLTVFGATIFVGIGNGLTLPGCSAGVMSIDSRLAGSASGLLGALTVGIGAVFTTLTGAVLTPTAGAFQLVGIMLACSAAGLAAMLLVPRQGRAAEGVTDGGR